MNNDNNSNKKTIYLKPILNYSNYSTNFEEIPESLENPTSHSNTDSTSTLFTYQNQNSLNQSSIIKSTLPMDYSNNNNNNINININNDPNLNPNLNTNPNSNVNTNKNISFGSCSSSTSSGISIHEKRNAFSSSSGSTLFHNEEEPSSSQPLQDQESQESQESENQMMSIPQPLFSNPLSSSPSEETLFPSSTSFLERNETNSSMNTNSYSTFNSNINLNSTSTLNSNSISNESSMNYNFTTSSDSNTTNYYSHSNSLPPKLYDSPMDLDNDSNLHFNDNYNSSSCHQNNNYNMNNISGNAGNSSSNNYNIFDNSNSSSSGNKFNSYFSHYHSLDVDSNTRKNKLWKRYQYLSSSNSEKVLSYTQENEKLLNHINRNPSSYQSLISNTCESCTYMLRNQYFTPTLMNKDEKYLKNSIRRLPSEIILKVFHYIIVDPMYYIPSAKDIDKENLNIKAYPKTYIYRYSYQPTFYSLALTCRWMASLALPFLYMNPYIFDSSSFISTMRSRQKKSPRNSLYDNSNNTHEDMNNSNINDDKYCNKNICWWCLAQKQLYGCYSNVNKNITRQILFNHNKSKYDDFNIYNSNGNYNNSSSDGGGIKSYLNSSLAVKNYFSKRSNRKIIPNHYESFEFNNYTNSINHITTIHPSLHKKTKILNDQMEVIDLVNQMLTDSKLTNEYQDIANILRDCHHLKTWTIYCRSGNEDEEDLNFTTNPLSSTEIEDNDNDLGFSSSTSFSTSAFNNDGRNLLMNSSQTLFVSNEDISEDISMNSTSSYTNNYMKNNYYNGKEKEKEKEKENKINISPEVIRNKFREELEEEMDYEQVSNYLDRGVYCDAFEKSGTIMLLSEIINSASTYNIVHDLQSNSEKIIKSSNKLLCYYKNIPNHPYYTEEIDIPYHISVIFSNKDINEANADKILNTIIDTKIIDIPLDEEESKNNENNTEIEGEEDNNNNINQDNTNVNIDIDANNNGEINNDNNNNNNNNSDNNNNNNNNNDNNNNSEINNEINNNNNNVINNNYINDNNEMNIDENNNDQNLESSNNANASSSSSGSLLPEYEPLKYIQKKINVILSHYLTHIHFASCANLSETWLNNLFKQSPNLLSITLRRAYHISDPTVCVLGQNCRQLRQLTLQSYRITDLSVVALSFFCTELRSLHLDITVSDNAISWLFSRCNKIHHFRIELSIGITGRALEYINNLGASRHLVELGIALVENPDSEFDNNNNNNDNNNDENNNNNNNNIENQNIINNNEDNNNNNNINNDLNNNNIENNEINNNENNNNNPQNNNNDNNNNNNNDNNNDNDNNNNNNNNNLPMRRIRLTPEVLISFLKNCKNMRYLVIDWGFQPVKLTAELGILNIPKFCPKLQILKIVLPSSYPSSTSTTSNSSPNIENTKHNYNPCLSKFWTIQDLLKLRYPNLNFQLVDRYNKPIQHKFKWLSI